MIHDIVVRMTAFTHMPVLPAAAADTMVAAGIDHAQSLGCAVTVVVVDETLTPMTLRRMDDADLLTVGLAAGKARLVAASGAPSEDWRSAFGDDRFLAATLPVAFDRLLGGAVLFGGGRPVRVEGRVIAGVGVSGGAEDQDEAIARAALAALPEADQPEPADVER